MNVSNRAIQSNSDIANPDGLNFKSFILSKMKAVSGSDGRRTLTSAELSDALGLSTKVFQEILNGRRSGPDRRDLVIALCAELALDAEDTSEALRLFPEALRPLSGYDRRDRFIMDFLNADFDSEISFAALNRQLRENDLPVLKTRYRNQSQDDGWRKHSMNKINWGLRSEEERQRYNYYTSLNYDDKTATVLALFTYGEEEIPRFRIQEAYEAFLEDRPYPPKPEPEDTPPGTAPIMSASYHGTFGAASPGTTLNQMALHLAPSPYTELEDDACVPFDADEAMAAPAQPPLARHESVRRPKLSLPRILPRRAEKASAPARSKRLRDILTDDTATDEYNPIEEKDFRDSMRDFTSTFRMTTNTASAGILFNQLRSRRGIDRSMVRIEEILNYFRYRHGKPQDQMFRISTEVKDLKNRN